MSDAAARAAALAEKKLSPPTEMTDIVNDAKEVAETYFETIQRLATLPTNEYERCRKAEAKRRAGEEASGRAEAGQQRRPDHVRSGAPAVPSVEIRQRPCESSRLPDRLSLGK